MIHDEVQKQNNGDDSVNIQNKGNNNTYYITRTSAKEELLELFIDNFPKLRQLAKEVVDDRINELIEQYLNKISQLEEQLANKAYERMSEPDLQYTIWETQKNYAKSGDKEKLEQLLSLLVDKSVETPKTLKDYLLDEAIQKVPMLTQMQLDLLSYLVSKGLSFTGITSIEDFCASYINRMIRFIDSLSLSYSNLSYLEQMGMVNNMQIKVSGNELIQIIKNSCQGYFASGFSKEEFLKEIEDKDLINITKKCMHNENLIQLTPYTLNEYNDLLSTLNISENDKTKLWVFFNKVLPEDTIIQILKNISISSEKLFQLDSLVESTTLTPLGILLGLKNIEIKYSEKINWDFT